MMDKRSAVKFAKGKNGGQEDPPKPKQSVGLPTISVARPSGGGNTSGGTGGSLLKAGKTEASRKASINALPSIGSRENINVPAPASTKSSRRMSATDNGPQTAEFAYSKAVELALRKFGFWSSRSVPRGFKTKYLEADIPCLNTIYEDYVFMRRSRGESTSGPAQNLEAEYRAPVPRCRAEAPVSDSAPSVSTPVGRDTPMPKRLRSGAITRFPSLAVEIRMKKPPQKLTAESSGSRRSSVVSMSLQ